MRDAPRAPAAIADVGDVLRAERQGGTTDRGVAPVAARDDGRLGACRAGRKRSDPHTIAAAGVVPREVTMRKSILVACALALAGCAVPGGGQCWYRADATEAIAAQDLADARRIAAERRLADHPEPETSTYAIQLGAIRRAEIVDQVMRSRGYSLVTCDSAGTVAGR